MNWDTLFGVANIWALASWAVLLLLPRGEITKALVFYLGIGLLCLAYSVLFVLLVTGSVDNGALAGAGGAGFTTIEGVRNIFMSDGGVTVGWIHYLALDLFAGMWIARDADAKGISRIVQAPVLLLTFIAGPFGLLIWLIIREPAARRANPRKGKLKL
ncbi:ABA4-like family protein [Alteraurantiacibacter aquimixticola]|uniref:DUF4281 domain-containing protein n=1 Tax=Alteraurantiacibacter aquimixticola TaxID=2489173 RepID=A0A4T3F5R5_9SPHN|nr:ABA4-like family protein [Alteraurantiacibacter aquimixticola]TIX51829.1 DUF4281 domain-containing protein [Alteraurantiacibacter aquimixticola]